MSETPKTPETPMVPAVGLPGRSHYAGAYAREASERSLRSLPEPGPVAVGDRDRGWPPLVCPPASPVALWRYAAEAPWCASYALRLRRAGMAYAVLVALPVAATAYSAAWLAQAAPVPQQGAPLDRRVGAS
ncbi:MULTISPECIES: hypothetical protein [Protofrankia]|uniref:Uncharacterized protein n=1 Tax=Candidatus Protofrankia datiscae TaxID=2716812 RepID=F8AXA3_9ACTN|nr:MULTISPECIES: hypothetical protein [Protofrankia]AEH08455.1 hypothetical protein FsymDg_0949 [Candidatus Protofrankia datiscae]